MDWVGMAKWLIVLVILALSLFALYEVWRAGKEKGKREGREEAIKEENESVIKAEEHLADKLEHGNPLFRVSDGNDTWTATTTSTSTESGVAQGGHHNKE